MNIKYGKLVSRDKDGNLTEVYPEILCDTEIDFINKRSVNPISNYVIANALEGLEADIRNSIRDAFSSDNGGLGWNDNIQKGYVDFSKMPTSQIEGIVNSMVDPNGAIVADSTSGKLNIDFSKLPENQIKDVVNAMVDPNGAIVGDSVTGLLTVDFGKLTADQIMALCSTNGGIIASNETGANHGKLAIDFSKMPADQIKNVVNSMVDQTGAIIPNTSVPSTNPNYGKLTVDFSKLTAAQVMALCLAGGGIVADTDTGKLKIDFSKIDADTKRNITSSLKMQTPLTVNKTIYVDNKNGNNTYQDSQGILIEGKGETVATAFKSISAAIKYITEWYAVGTRTVYIDVIANIDDQNKEMPYAEAVTLPPFNGTSGVIVIRSHDLNNRTKVVNSSYTSKIFTCTGGKYYLQNLDIEGEYGPVNNGHKNYVGIVSATTYGDLTLYGCHCKCGYKEGEPADSLWYSVEMFVCSNYGAIHFGVTAGTHNTIEYHKNNASQLYVLNAQNCGLIDFNQSGNTEETVTLDIPVSNTSSFNTLCNNSQYSSLTTAASSTSGNKLITAPLNILKSFITELGLGNDIWPYLASDSMYVVETWGECTIYCRTTVSSLVRGGSGGNYQQRFHIPKGKAATGKRYDVSYLSTIVMSSIFGSFPGSIDGTCMAGTFSSSNTAINGLIASTIFDEGFSYLAKTEKATGSKTFGAGLFGNTVAMTANAINLALGTVFTKTITANTTFIITGTPASTAATFNLILTNGGSKVITWPNSVKWTDGTPPELTASGIDVLTFLTSDGGTTWYGCLAMNGAA